MFYVGQKVVCIKAYTSQLTEGEIYTIQGLWECCMLNLDVGLNCYALGSHCNDCEDETSDSIAWTQSKQFVTLDEWEAICEAVADLEKDINIPVLV